MTIKQLVGQVPGAKMVNANRRSWQVERRYRAWERHYRDVETPELREVWARRGLGSLRMPVRPKVFFCGTDERQDSGGFLQCLAKYSDLRVFRQPDGTYGQVLAGNAWRSNGAILETELSRLRAERWIPDILLMQSMGSRLDPDDLRAIKKEYRFTVVNIGMDERLAWRMKGRDGRQTGISALNSVVDLALVSTPEVVRWYLAEGVPAKYFPLASSGDSYFPIPRAEKKYDVGFVGSAYGERLRLARVMEGLGVSFCAYGPGWPNGALDPEDANVFYNSCRLVLGSGKIGYCKNLMNPKLRDIEVPLTSVPYITDRTPELAQMYLEGSEVILFEGMSELSRQVVWYLANPERAAKVGHAGFTRAVNDHQYDSRLEALFGEMLVGNLDVDFAHRKER